MAFKMISEGLVGTWVVPSLLHDKFKALQNCVGGENKAKPMQFIYRDDTNLVATNGSVCLVWYYPEIKNFVETCKFFRYDKGILYEYADMGEFPTYKRVIPNCTMKRIEPYQIDWQGDVQPDIELFGRFGYFKHTKSRFLQFLFYATSNNVLADEVTELVEPVADQFEFYGSVGEGKPCAVSGNDLTYVMMPMKRLYFK